MFKWTAFPFLRFSLALALGILLSHYFPAIWERSFAAVYLLFFFFLLALNEGVRRAVFRGKLATGLLGFVVLMYLGGVIYKLDADRFWSSHYTKYPSIKAFSGQVTGDINETRSGYRFTVDVLEIISDDSVHEVSGKAQVFVRAWAQAPEIGDYLYAQGGIAAIPEPGNPGQFNYSEYMARQQVYGQAFLDSAAVKWVHRESVLSLDMLALTIREQLISDMRGYFNDDEALQIAQALLLGVKKDMSDDLRAAYATAGATHVLAVSGLHVGIVYLLLLRLFGGLRRYKYGKFIFVGCVIVCIWLYAMITGMSASVFRSATMFTILALGELSGNDRNIYNTLGIAAFILLLYHPPYLFDLGFQFSYLAVFGIVYFFPKIHRLWHPSQRLLKYAWSATCVSISAQIAVAPLSIYYFHQFPTYFVLTNLVVVLFAFAVLLIGLPMIVIGTVLPEVALFLAFPLEVLIMLLNTLIRGVESLPGSSVTGIAITMSQVLWLYGSLAMLLWSMQFRRFTPFLLASICMVGFLFDSHARTISSGQDQRIVIYDVRDALVMDFVSHGQAQLVSDSISSTVIDSRVDPARYHWGYPRVGVDRSSAESSMTCDSLVCTTIWEGQRVVRIHSDLNAFEIKDTISTDVLVLSNNARISPTQWGLLSFQYLVFDGTNDYWYVNRVQSRLAEDNISGHFVREDGYWQLDLTEQNPSP